MNSLKFTKYSSKIGNLQTKMKGCGVSCLLSGLKAVSEIRLNEVWTISKRTLIFNNLNRLSYNLMPRKENYCSLMYFRCSENLTKM